MPHLTLEYSANVRENKDFSELFSRLHTVLEEVAGATRLSCKSRARAAEQFYVADGATSHAFVHLDIRLLVGRTPEAKKQLGARALALLKEWFADSVAKLALQITVEVRDIDLTFYSKHPEGTLPKH